MKRFLFKEVDNSALILFRIVWGFLLMAEGWGAIITGWVFRVFVEPSFTFTWYGFEWTRILLGEFMYIPYLIMGLCGLFIMIGYRFRLSSTLFAILWGLVFFMQKSEYNNHYYLVLLICMAMPFTMASSYMSLDSKRKPTIKSLSCPNWNVVLLPFMMFLVYFFGAIAKIYPDWLQAKPIALWFSGKEDYPILGSIMVKTWFHYFISYSGILFDLLIIPLLMFKQTRKWAFVSTLFFHLFNAAIFQIGIFPFLGLSFAMFFWPSKQIGKWFLKKSAFYESTDIDIKPIKWLNAKFYLIIAFALFQVVTPIRHWAIPGDVLWTEEGHRLSWRMMLRSKSGYGTIFIEENNKRTVINPGDYLTKNQIPMIYTQPDCLHQFVELVGSEKQTCWDTPEITASIHVSVNGGGYNRLVDNKVNLYTTKRHRIKHDEWILFKP